MNVLEAQDIIAAYMLRSSTALKTAGNVNLIVRALNNAKKFAQRRHDFELCKCTASVSVSPLPTGGALSSAVLYGTATAVSIKRIERAAIANTAGGTLPVHFASREWIEEHVRRRVDVGTLDLLYDTNASSTTSDPVLIQQGDKIYFYPDVTAAKTVYLDIVKWLADYDAPITGTASSTSAGNLVCATETFATKGVKAGDIVWNTTDSTSATVDGVTNETTLDLSTDIFVSGEAYSVGNGVSTDFLLDHGFDFLMFRSITELNFYLKDDQRVNISQAKLNEAWDSMLAWDSLMIPSTGDD